VEKLDSAINSLSDQARKYDIAMYYTNGDQEKSKRMVANSYSDMVAIKARFSSSSLYGAFILFFNHVVQHMDHVLFVISPDYQIQSLNSMDDWKNYERSIMDARLGAVARASEDFGEKFRKGFVASLNKEMAKYVKNNDLTQIIHILHRLLQEGSDLKRIELTVDLQKISSLQMELDSQTSKKIDSKLKARKMAEEANKQPEEEDSSGEPQVGKDGVKLIITSTVVLSPIKGKYISNVVPGDKIMVSMVDKNPQVTEIAKAFNAYKADEKKVSPVPARVLSIEYVDGIGYKIFAVIAKGIIAQIIEEESNIKIGMDPASPVYNTEEESSSSSMGMPIIIGLVVAIVLLIGFVLFVVL
jgi:hypothetical protein